MMFSGRDKRLFHQKAIFVGIREIISDNQMHMSNILNYSLKQEQLHLSQSGDINEGKVS